MILILLVLIPPRDNVVYDQSWSAYAVGISHRRLMCNKCEPTVDFCREVKDTIITLIHSLLIKRLLCCQLNLVNVVNNIEH